MNNWTKYFSFLKILSVNIILLFHLYEYFSYLDDPHELTFEFKCVIIVIDFSKCCMCTIKNREGCCNIDSIIF